MANILLLEDDETLASQISMMLEMEGHSIEIFEDATSAIARFDDLDADLIIADLFIEKEGAYVPDGGIKLISYIRQIRLLDLPIIAISGSFTTQNKEHAMTSAKTVGASSLLAKPFHPDTLLDQVNTLLGRE